MKQDALGNFSDRVVRCRTCQRLVEYREEVARTKRRAYVDWDYWGRPVPSFGKVSAQLLIVGLAPGAHGANRTGRIFTGDSSGDLLYATLYKYGFSNQPRSDHIDDGLSLKDAYVTAALHCVPPHNKPLRDEVSACRQYLTEELSFLKQVRVVVALGEIAWRAYLDSLVALGRHLPSPRPRFGHREEITLDDGTVLLGCYHPSRQNTQTGRLSVEMFESVFSRAQQLFAAP